MGLSRTEIVIFISEVICILFYGLFVEYGDGVNGNKTGIDEDKTKDFMQNTYPLF